MKENEMGIVQRTVRSIVRGLCGVQLKDRKKAMDLMLGFTTTIDQFAMANSVCWYAYEL